MIILSKECGIVQDLIPLVNDGVASQESQIFVKKHCESCEECRALLENPPHYDSQNLNKKWRKKLRITWIGFLILMILIATSFSATQYQFQNFILIPLIGGIGYWLLRKKVYVLYILVFISQMGIALFQQESFNGMMMYVVIYWFFMTIGIIIGGCYCYAFSRRNYNEN